ncbi:MAG: histidine--tRNA ligase [Candidatus Heimdallarchaeota archaeon]|nr:histidine--tRNA ligase [Candidatus Heimdallarchaeota archaeon]MCK5048268.1 histidine--tRNA ligase [Candidatus Heimdallarchaeota archaeon]
MRLDLDTPKGTTDIIEIKASLLQKMMHLSSRVAELHGYEPVFPPLMEFKKILSVKSSEELAEGLFSVIENTQIRKLTSEPAELDDFKYALRFDATIGSSRIVASQYLKFVKPVKFYYVGPMWRDEDTKRTRLREFWQFGIELIGPEGALADAEVIWVLNDFFKETGIKDFRIKVSDRGLINALLSYLGVPEEEEIRLIFLRALDKTEKMTIEEVNSYIDESYQKLSSETKEEINETKAKEIFEELLDIMTIKGDSEERLETLAKMVTSELGKESLKKLKEVFEICKKMGMEKTVEFDTSIVRGLDYYTGIVFEVEADYSGGSLAGGGRYDNLVGLLGGQEVPAAGFAIGLNRVIDCLVEQEPREKEPRAKCGILPLNEKMLERAFKLADELRKEGITIELETKFGRLGTRFDKLDRLGIENAILVGEKDAKNEQYTIRNLKESEEITGTTEEVIKFIKKH